MRSLSIPARIATIAALFGLTLTGCGSGSSSPTQSPTAPTPRAVVLVSGLATQTPFTTTTQKCEQGLSAGISFSALRDGLIAAGQQVFTAPAQSGPTEVTSTSGLGASSQCPQPLPTSMTIDTTASIDAGGANLVSFLQYLHDTYQLETVDLVGYSMGGLFSRSAIKLLKDKGAPITVRSLTTLGTPWTGTYPADFANGSLPLSVCKGDATCLSVLPGYRQLSDEEGPQGAAAAIATDRLQGPGGWNARQGGALDGIPVTLVGGDFFRKPGGVPRVWPNDGIVSEQSALASGIPKSILPRRACVTRPDVHTVDLAQAQQQAWTTAITWDPAVVAVVDAAVRGAGSA
ncbi:MAG: alpha/beta hydrolase, partial [Actinomycetes bacterium]